MQLLQRAVGRLIVEDRTDQPVGVVALLKSGLPLAVVEGVVLESRQIEQRDCTDRESGVRLLVNRMVDAAVIAAVVIAGLALPANEWWTVLPAIAGGAMIMTFVIQVSLQSKDGLVMRMLVTVTGAILLDYAAVAVFALTGALAASRSQLDIVGFIFVASLTAVGGGTLRDIILDRVIGEHGA